MTIKCEKCGKRFTKSSKAGAEQALRMHDGRVHLKTILTPPPELPKGGTGKSNANGVPLLPSGEPDRRSRAWKASHPLGRRQRASEETAAVCYCHQCGFNLLALGTAMQVARKLTQP